MHLITIADFAVPLVVGLTGLCWALGWLRSARRGYLVAGFGLLFFALRVVPIAWQNPESVFDFQAFWTAGHEVRSGLDPIVENQTKALPPLNLPTAFPLFAVFAMLPYRASLVTWTICNGLLVVGLSLLAWRLSKQVQGATDQKVGLALFVATIALSNGTRSCLQSGQLGILTTVCLLVAEYARRQRNVSISAIGLAASSIKIATMVPFALLFIRRGDRRILILAALICFGLAAITESPRDMPVRARQWLATLSRLGAPGMVNDFADFQNDDMIGLDHAFYRAGIRHRELASLLKSVILCLLGAALLDEVLLRKRHDEPTLLALVSIYAAVFLYHRSTDLTILAAPYACCLWQARTATGSRRLRFWFAAAGLLAVLFIQRRGLFVLRQFATSHPGVLSRIIETILLPSACWSLLIVFGMLYFDRGVKSRKANEIGTSERDADLVMVGSGA